MAVVEREYSVADAADPSPHATTRLPQGRVLLIALLVAAVRALYAGAPMTSDEGGFLMIAHRWTGAGQGLYGSYWVDRPPLLVEFFRIGDQWGGLTGLRFLGCVFAAAAVWLTGFGAGRAFGAGVAPWAAGVTGAMLVSPLVGAVPVNGELLAAPFIAGGFAAVAVAVRSTGARAVLAAAGAGACAIAAVLVKQNMVDVIVFGLVAGIVSLVSGRERLRRVLVLAAAGAAGAVVAGSAVLGFAAAKGADPGAIFYAMYPFRVKAGHLLRGVGFDTRWHRLTSLGIHELFALTPLILIGLVIAVRTYARSHRSLRAVDPLVAAVLTAVLYAGFSIVAGGSYWSHYLVQLAVPLGLAAGVVAREASRGSRALLVIPIVASCLAAVLGLAVSLPASGQLAGRAIGDAARPHDAVVVVLGSGDLVQSTGLDSPYEYLWSLPSRVRDPQLAALRAIITGPRAPQWLVIRSDWYAARLRADGLDGVIADRYRLVATVCGRPIYLLRGADRPTPTAPASCRLPMAPWLTTHGVRSSVLP